MRCRTCDYDIFDIAHSGKTTCPECGTQFDLRDKRTWVTDRNRKTAPIHRAAGWILASLPLSLTPSPYIAWLTTKYLDNEQPGPWNHPGNHFVFGVLHLLWSLCFACGAPLVVIVTLLAVILNQHKDDRAFKAMRASWITLFAASIVIWLLPTFIPSFKPIMEWWRD